MASDNKRLFRDEKNLPIKFFIHPDTRKKDTINALTQNIKKYGGRVTEQREEANTILVPTGEANKFRAAYKFAGPADQSRPEVFVEDITFIGHCIRWNKVSHRIPETKGMGGPRTGRRRVPFTDSDDENLCRYMAVVIPEKEAGGRLGLELYDTLCNTAISEPDEFAWAARHTKESWKQRYKTHREEFDTRIEKIVSNLIPKPVNLLGRDRRVKAGSKRYYDEEEGNDNDEDRDGGSLPPPSPPRVPDPDSEESDEDEGSAPPSPPRVASSSQEKGPASKKRRIYRHENRQSEISQGKKRAVEDVESEDEPSSLFSANEDISEDDFFGDVPVASRSLDHSPAAPGPSTIERRPQSSPASRKTSTINNHGADLGRPAQRPVHEKSSMPPSSSPARNAQFHRMSLLQSSPAQIINLSPKQQSQSQHIVAKHAPNSSYQRPRKAARRPVSATKPRASPAPYKNTRSRTAMTEHQAKVIEANSDIIELSDDELPEHDPPAVQRLLAISDKEDEEEEEDVADLVTVGRTTRLSQNMRRVSLDTDDAQIASSLERARHTEPQHSSSFGANRIRPSDILKEYEEADESMSSRHSRSGILNSYLLAPTLASQSQAVRQGSQDPRTPKQVTRVGSVSSVGSNNFPILGTKASAYKKDLTQRAKEAPYTPPPGTRAAQFIRSR